MANLVTLAEYKAYAGINSTNSDTVINSIIPKVSELVKNLCRRSFVDNVVTPITWVTDGGMGSRIYVKEYPIITLTDLEHSHDYGQTYEALVEYTDYVYNKEEGYIEAIGGDFPKTLKGYRITYTGGYTTLPEDLKIAVLDLVKYYIQNDGAVHSTKAPGTNSVQIEYITSTSLPAHIRRVLDLYVGSFD